MPQNLLLRHIPPWLAFSALIISYCLTYAPYGFENNDGGFILGLAHQVYLGGSFYDHIIYVRPPLSPLLHSFVFNYPFSTAPILFDRFFVFIQIATYSALSALIAKQLFAWPNGFTSTIASLIFIFSAHTFPSMAWHTIDGIFFSVIALYFLFTAKQHTAYLVPSALFSILAAASKQPFYLTPILLLSLTLMHKNRRRAFGVMLASLILSSILFFVLFKEFISISSMWSAISSQTRLNDLVFAGVKHYLSDVTKPFSIIAVGPLLIALIYNAQASRKSLPASITSVYIGIWVSILAIGYTYISAKTWSAPPPIFNAIFFATLLYCINMARITQDGAWFIIGAMHIIAWTSSISWGYLTSALYAAPSIISLATIFKTTQDSSLFRISSPLPILAAAAFIFHIGNQFTYSLEGPVRRDSLNVEMAEISPALNFIKSSRAQFNLYRELTQILARYKTNAYVVLPNMPLAHTLTNSTNPIGIDWVLNAEIGKNDQLIKDRLNNSIEYAVIYNHAAPKPESKGPFGSAITMHVAETWDFMASSKNFSIYLNPNSATGKLRH